MPIKANISGAANGNAHMEQALRDIDDDLRGLRASISTQATPTVAIPPLCDFGVVGIDGHFVVSITNPEDASFATVTLRNTAAASPANPSGRKIMHELESSTESTFNTASLISSYGPSAQTEWQIKDPNQTKYWRLRSRYDGGTPNEWALMQSVAACGVVSIWSGLLKNSSSDFLLSSSTTSTGASPLSQHGLTTQIDVAASSWKCGSQTIAFLSGSVDPGAYGTFFVYAIDLKKAGGQVTFLSTTAVADLTSQDGLVFFGTITTVAGGGGTGSGGGGGYTGGGGGCCVGECEAEMLDGSKKAHTLLVEGDILKGVDGGPETLEQIELSIQPTFRLEFENGIIHRGASSSHPLQYEGGGFGNVFDAVVGDRFNTKLGASKLTAKPYLGKQLVYKLRLSRTRTFWADDTSAHNANKA